MAITARIDVLNRDIAVFLKEELSPEAMSRAFGTFARQAIEDTDDANDAAAGRDLKYQTFVDGSRSDNLETAKSTIVAEWEVITDTFEWIEELLITYSPRGPDVGGHYGESHVFLADGVVADPAKPPTAEEYLFTNSKRYARKLEKLYGVYQVVAALAQRRFGNSARVGYTFTTYAGERQPAIWIQPR